MVRHCQYVKGQLLGALRLAVSAPRCVEFKQDILLVIEHNALVGVRHNDCHRAFLFLGNGLRFDAGLNLAVKDLLDEFTNIFGLNLLLLVIRVFRVFFRVLDGEGREGLRVEVEVSSVGAKQLGVNGGNVDGTLVLLSNGLEVLGELFTLLLGFGENVCQWDTSLNHR